MTKRPGPTEVVPPALGETDDASDIDIAGFEEDAEALQATGERIMHQLLAQDAAQEVKNKEVSRAKRHKREYNPEIDVQIQSSPAEVAERVDGFIRRAKGKATVENTAEFRELQLDAARVDTVLLKRAEQIQRTVNYNADGPLSDSTHAQKQQIREKFDEVLLPPALEERVSTLETHLGIVVDRVPADIWARLKRLEDKIIEIEDNLGAPISELAQSRRRRVEPQTERRSGLGRGKTLPAHKPEVRGPKEDEEGSQA